MALSFLARKPKLLPVERDADGTWVFFDGTKRISDLSISGNGYTSRHMFAKDSPYTGAGRASVVTPPYHYHIYQTEIFEPKQGVMCYLLEGKEYKAKVGDVVTVQPGQKHTFWSDQDAEEGLRVDITVRGGGDRKGLDEAFFHNLFGYMDSLRQQGQSPSIFQMLAFMDSADVVLADIPFGLGRLVNVVVGRWIGRYLLGYQPSYKIYNEGVTQ
ncbi:hypothetical protein PLEOSDRAFT_171576 [Pleurotus ostreatus PC15]|uniref:Cupin type-2 domain-containing protein n=1 Tax=Pleurotus ostreatus (strain PC15) TaxID=1137138 RepID=A0A067ND96_PLEO1|nr:hypothetical protein PLEOSDRAFT_171576 [Pleurotus ostreatus PC15]